MDYQHDNNNNQSSTYQHPHFKADFSIKCQSMSESMEDCIQLPAPTDFITVNGITSIWCFIPCTFYIDEFDEIEIHKIDNKKS